MSTLTEPLDNVDHSPPAPILRLPVRAVAGGPATVSRFFLDTGADFTCLPSSVAAALIPNDRGTDRRFRAGDGTPGVLPTVRAEIELLGHGYGAFFAVTFSETGLLGRDVLRHFVVTVDGPAGTLTVAD